MPSSVNLIPRKIYFYFETLGGANTYNAMSWQPFSKETIPVKTKKIVNTLMYYKKRSILTIGKCGNISLIHHAMSLHDGVKLWVSSV